VKRYARRFIVTVIFAVATLAPAGAAPARLNAAGQPAQVDQPLRLIAQQRPTDTVHVIVQARHAADAEQAVQQSGGQAIARLPYIAGLAAEIRADQIDAVARRPGVVRLALDPAMRGVSVSRDAIGAVSVFPQTIGAPVLWGLGDTGRGVAIAVLDSGIQSHPDLGTPSRIAFSQRFNRGASSAADQYGHGTWVAGIAGGDGASSAGQYTGVAPQASIINLKVSDDTGAAYASDVLQALGWVAANHVAFNIRVVNLSFVSSLAEGYATNLLDAAVELVWHSGVAVVVSAGNRGADSMLYAPANDPYVITVGASDDRATVAVDDDVLAWFSSYGRTQDGFSKPDLVAPGRHIVGLLANNGPALAKEFPTKVVNQRYIQLSGTSASAAVTSGAVALLAQARPNLTPDQTKWLLMHTARSIGGVASGLGAGQLDVAAAATFSGQIGRANLGLVPNRLVGLAYLSQQDGSSVGWDSVNWNSVSWDSVSWDSVSWDSVSWDSVSWDSVSWDSVSWDSVIGND
jgi:serine protease AprX